MFTSACHKTLWLTGSGTHTKKKQIQATISQFFRCKDHSSSMFVTNFNEFKSVHYKTIKTRVHNWMKRTESQKKEHEKREALFENGKTNAILYFFRNEIENWFMWTCSPAWVHITQIKKITSKNWLSLRGQDFHALCIRQSEFSYFSLVRMQIYRLIRNWDKLLYWFRALSDPVFVLGPALPEKDCLGTKTV